MKKILLPLSLWAVTAAGAYYLGTQSSTSTPAAASKETAAASDKARASANRRAGSTGAASESAGGLALPSLSADNESPMDFLAKSRRFTAAELADILPKVLKESDPVIRNRMLMQLLENLDATTLPIALKAIEEGPRGRQYDQELRLFMYAWGKLDGKAAMEYSMSDKGRRVDFGGTTAISAWASQDKDAAKAYLDEVKDERQKGFLTFGLIDGWAKSDLKGASTYVETLPQGPGRGFYVDLLAEKHLQQGGVEGAVAWVQGIDGSEANARYKQQAFEKVLEEASRTDLTSALKLAEANLKEPYASGGIEEVVQRYAEQDPKAALTWVMAKTEGEAQSKGVETVFDRWARSDPAAAGEWLNNTPNDGTYDSARSAYAERIAREDPQSAITWAGTIQDSKTKVETLTEVAQRWMRTDAEAARAWVAASDLPEEAKKAVTEPRRGWDRGNGNGGGAPGAGGPPGGFGGGRGGR